MVDLEAVLDGLEIVVGTACLGAALDHAVDQLILRHLQPHHMVDFLATFLQEAVERLSLGDGAGETVENHPVFCFGVIVDDFFKDLYHQGVRYELSLVDVRLRDLTDWGLAGDMVTQHLTCRDVVQSVTFDKFFALGALSAARSAENHNIHLSVFTMSFTWE